MIYKSYEALAKRYDYLTAQEKAIKAEKESLKADVKDAMGADDRLALTNGWYFKKYPQYTKAYNVAQVMSVLGNDAIPFLCVAKTPLDAFLAMQVAEYPSSQWPLVKAELESGQTTETSYALKLIKG